MSQTAQYEIHPNDNPKYKFVITGPGLRGYTTTREAAEQCKAQHEHIALEAASKRAERIEDLAKQLELMLMPYVGRVLTSEMLEQEIAADLRATLKSGVK